MSSVEIIYNTPENTYHVKAINADGKWQGQVIQPEVGDKNSLIVKYILWKTVATIESWDKENTPD